MKNFDVEWGGTTYSFEGHVEGFKHFFISDGVNLEAGEVIFMDKTEGNKESYQWQFIFENDTTFISFDDLNDPRVIELKSRDHLFYVLNQEPDCNSIFSLFEYDENVGEYNYIDENRIADAEASDPCGKANWKFKYMNQGDMITSGALAFMFTTIVAQNVRNFQYY